MGRIREKSEKWIRAAAIGVMILLFAVLFWLFMQGFSFYEDAKFLSSFAKTPERAALCALAVVFFLILYTAVGKWLSGCQIRTLRIVQNILTAGMPALQCYFLFYVRSYYKWDSGYVIGAAASLAETGSVAQEAYYYLSVYPNQNTFVLITAALVKFGDLFGVGAGNRSLVFNCFNTICLDIALLLTLKLLKRWKTKLQDWQLCRIFLLFLCNPFLYLGVSYYYTITLSLPLTMGFLYLVCGMRKKNGKGGYGTALLAGALLGVGYELRATAVILGIALLAAGIWEILKGSGRKTAARLAVLLLSAFLCGACLNGVQKAYVGIDTTDTAFPTTHWLMMSLTMPGSHNAEDEAYTASFATKEEKTEAVSERMAEKLAAMSGAEYLTLIKTKISNTFGTGMNGYPVFLADALKTDGVYEAVFGEHKDFVILWHQGYHLFLLLGILLYILKWVYDGLRGKKTDAYGFLLLLILFGAILFYALWEASAQYSVPFMFIMETLCFAGFSDWENAAVEAAGEPEKRKWQRKAYTAAAYFSYAAAAVIVLWGAVRYRQFTQTTGTYSHPAAVQILANTSYPVDDQETLVQTLKLTQPFNRLILQWRNPAQEESTAVYSLQLRKRDGEVVFETEIDAAETGYNGAGIYDFETISPESGEYEIRMEKISGEPEDDLEFVVYDMYGYTPYSDGELSLQTQDGEQSLTASLLFSVSEETTESYTTPKKYLFFISVLFLIFLFMGFWCKLRVVSDTGEES